MDIKEQQFVLSLFSYSGRPPRGGTASFVVIPAEVYPANIGILPKGKIFSVFNSRHVTEASTVYNFLIERNDDEFEEAVGYLRGILNEGIFLYALSVALLHRKKGTVLPPIWQISPRNFFASAQIAESRRRAKQEDAAMADPGVTTKTIPWTDVQPFTTGTLRDPEFKIAWWREDIGLNDHHWQWHKAYPWSGVNGKTKDREGELFYYMHQQMLARYDAERMATGLMRVLPFEDWIAPIQEGYNSHLSDYYGTSQFSPRPAGLVYADNYTEPENPVTVRQQYYHVNRLLDAITTDSFLKGDGSRSPVDIDSLGAAIESSISSPNSQLYGSVHNLGHDLLSVIADPDGRHKLNMGVMGDTLTAIRDPIFFRWHKFIDNLFVQHKTRLTPYDKDELDFNKVVVQDISVKSGGATPKNVLKTFMEEKYANIKYDMFQDEATDPEVPHSDVWVKVTNASHDDFHYVIEVTNKNRSNVKAAFRIFLAPRFAEHSSERFVLPDQRRLFIELDKFVEEVKPGKNQIERSSKDSSVVRPPSRTMKDLQEMVKKSKPDTECREGRYCKCGWPMNLLIPRGTVQGMAFDLFVMVTDWSKDKVKDGTDDLDRGTSYCGTKSSKYPDRRPMGFPFDRPIDGKFLLKDAQHIEEFASHFDNMKTTPINIRLDNEKKMAKVPKENELKY